METLDKMDVSKCMAACFKNDIKAYPIKTVTGWKIQYEILGKKATFQKVLKPSQINNAMEKTYEHLYKTYC